MEAYNSSEGKKGVELVFPEGDPPVEDNWIKKGPTGDVLRRFSANIDEISAWFRNYDVDTIEVWISGIIETGGVTKLVVSAKGEGGLRVVLKPKK